MVRQKEDGEGGSEDHHWHCPYYPGTVFRTLHTSVSPVHLSLLRDRSTREVFGDYIDIYDMTQAVEDGATRPVYYESRVIHLKLDEKTLHLIDDDYDLMAQNADPYVIEKSKKNSVRWKQFWG